MIAKTFEVRDSATFIAVLAVQLGPTCEPDRYLFARSGYGTRPEDQATYVQLIKLAGGEGRSDCDPYSWGNRTMEVAHSYIIKNFAELKTGAVIDVQFILGETKEAKRSECDVGEI